MTLKSGLAGQIGFGEESTWGVGVTPTVFLPLVSEKLTAEVDFIESDAVYAGRRLLLADQVGLGTWKVGGDIGLELTNKSVGLLFKHMFGGVSTTGSGPYVHTFTPGDLAGLGLTVQVGRPGSSTGTVDPYTYVGSKISEWELGCKAGENATLGLTILARQELTLWTVTDGVTTSGSPTITSATGGFSDSDIGKPVSGSVTGIPANSYIGSVVDSNTATLSSSSFTNTPVNATATTSSNTFTMGMTLASASYASSILPMNFTFNGGGVTIGGTSVKVMEMSLKASNGLDDGREFIGQNWLDEGLEGDRREYTGTLSTEYFTPAQYRRFLSGSPFALVMTFGKGTSTAVITMNAQYRGSTPNLDGTSVVKQDLPFKVLAGSTDASGITAVLTNSDATP
jgi:hypothetical protein